MSLESKCAPGLYKSISSAVNTLYNDIEREFDLLIGEFNDCYKSTIRQLKPNYK